AQNSEGYQAKTKRLKTIQIESGLYVEVNGKNDDIVSYLTSSTTDLAASAKKEKAKTAINTFINYLSVNVNPSAGQIVSDNYRDYRLNSSLTYEGVTYFVLDNNEVVENAACKAKDEDYFNNVYAKYIDDRCQGYIVTLVPEYHSLLYFESMMLIFAEIMPAYLVAGLLVYLLPPLCNPRGHMTLGKLLYHISLADYNVLAISAKKFLARFAIFYFAELVLSMVTFGIPYLVSFSMMAFSKQKQGFPDYMLGIQEVDTSGQKLFKSFDEIRLSGVDKAKKGVDFKVTYED
ncbi:MAG: RDD family protein, partial [Bacilli bacterium]|nr:RDD family protein [Bacilli bacterium]